MISKKLSQCPSNDVLVILSCVVGSGHLLNVEQTVSLLMGLGNCRYTLDQFPQSTDSDLFIFCVASNYLNIKMKRY